MKEREKVNTVLHADVVLRNGGCTVLDYDPLRSPEEAVLGFEHPSPQPSSTRRNDENDTALLTMPCAARTQVVTISRRSRPNWMPYLPESQSFPQQQLNQVPCQFPAKAGRRDSLD
jgi:hypothetical protein